MRIKICAPTPTITRTHPCFSVKLNAVWGQRFVRFSKWRQTSNLHVLQRKKIPTLPTTLPRKKAILSVKPKSLEQISVSLKTLQRGKRSWFARIFDSHRSLSHDIYTDWFGVCSNSADKYSVQYFYKIKRKTNEEDIVIRTLKLFSFLCQYLSLWTYETDYRLIPTYTQFYA